MDNQENQIDIKEPKEKGSMQKVLIIGLPLFIIQLVVVYFVTGFLLSGKVSHSGEETKEEKMQVEEGEVPPENLGVFVNTLEDIIVNPSDTDGKRLLLTSVSIDVATEENLNEVKNKEPLVKDIIISTLAAKTISELGDPSKRDSIKIEISDKLRSVMPAIGIDQIYFSKYIMQ